MCRCLVVIVLSLLGAPVQPAQDPHDPIVRRLQAEYTRGPFDLVEADYLVSDSPTPPTAESAWIATRLPALWGPRTAGNDPPRSIWYRFRLPDEPPPYPAAVYLWRFSMNVGVWMNDALLGDGGRFDEPIARNWNRPFLFLLPDVLWQAPPNHLYVRLLIYPGWGNLPPIVVGPRDELRADYERRFAWQITASQATFVVSLLSALVAFTFWWSDRRSPLYGIFGCTCLAWSIYSANLFVQNIPVSAGTWWWLVHSSVDFYGVTLALFAHRLMGLDRPRLDRVLLVFGLAASLYYAVVDLPTLSATNSVPHGVTLLITVYVMATSFYLAALRRRLEEGAFAACMAVVVIFAVHDFSMNSMINARLWQTSFFWLQFSAPILMVTMLVILARRFVNVLKERAWAEAQVRNERERIFSDIHDDVGSKVLSLVYSASTPEQASLARDTLREIRAIVSGAMRRAETLGELLAGCQAEARERCESAGIELTWQTEIDESSSISDTFHYHVQRILRELVSNVMRHSGSKRCDVLAHAQQGALHVTVRDYGVGGVLGDDPTVRGSGMAGVSRRTDALGGRVSWREAAPGWLVELSLPLHAGSATT